MKLYLQPLDEYGTAVLIIDTERYIFYNCPLKLWCICNSMSKKGYNTNTIIKLLEKECGKGVKSINHILNRECAKSIVHLLKTNADITKFNEYADKII